MKIKVSQLRQLVRESLSKISESYEVGPDGTIDLENPTVLWNDTFDMDDQETMTKVANRRINLNEPIPGEEDDVEQAIKTLMGSGDKLTSEAARAAKMDSTGNTSQFAIDRYSKKKSKLKDGKPLSMREAMAGSTDANVKGYLSKFFLKPGAESDVEPKRKKRKKEEGFSGQGAWGEPETYKKKKLKSRKAQNPYCEDKYPKKDGWQGERYRKQPLKTKHKPKTPMQKANACEDKFPDKAGWQGEKYRSTEPKRKKDKKRSLPTQTKGGGKGKDLEEMSPKGWEGTVKAMQRDKKKGKNKIDNPWALTNYMKNKGDTSHYTKSGKKKKT